mmetsp:Transcript_5447/g.9657  ORF Transcript_5447/g.9657 Transcript_5447/m.9657 type:complete len:348 (+) Transcript_5447:6803-7846(+)
MPGGVVALEVAALGDIPRSGGELGVCPEGVLMESNAPTFCAVEATRSSAMSATSPLFSITFVRLSDARAATPRVRRIIVAVFGPISCLASLPAPLARSVLLGPIRSIRLETRRSLRMICSFSSSSAKEVTSREKQSTTFSTSLESSYVRKLVSVGIVSATMGKHALGTRLHRLAAVWTTFRCMLMPKKSMNDSMAASAPSLMRMWVCSWDSFSNACRHCSARSMNSMASSFSQNTGTAPAATTVAHEEGRASIRCVRARAASSMMSMLCSLRMHCTSSGAKASDRNPETVSSVPIDKKLQSSVRHVNCWLSSAFSPRPASSVSIFSRPMECWEVKSFMPDSRLRMVW